MLERHSVSDIIQSFVSQFRRAPAHLPEREPETEEPTTPLERLEAGCRLLGVQLIDYRDLKEWPRDKEYPREYGWPRNKKRAMPHGTRSWNQLTGVCYHTFGVAGMGYRRFLGVPCHIGIDTVGNVVLCHYLTQYMYCSDAANRFTAGMEISGVGRLDNPIQAESALLATRYVFEERARNADPRKKYYDAGPIVMAHRMAARGKPLCCGREVWQATGERAIQEGWAKLGPVVGSGQAIDIWR